MEPKRVTIHTGVHFGQGIAFAPQNSNFIACVTGANYGLAGEGALLIYALNRDTGTHQVMNRAIWPDVLLDVSWRPGAPQKLLATCSGDGLLQIWKTPECTRPSAVSRRGEHEKEVVSVDWSRFEDKIVTGSWDGTVKIWDVPSLATTPPHTLLRHDEIVFEARWSPIKPATVASASNDGSALVWDLKVPSPVTGLAHGSAVLCCDWSPGEEHLLLTGAKDGMVRVWDLRQPAMPIVTMEGHSQAVRKVRWAGQGAVVSASYDFTVRHWDLNNALEKKRFSHHTEFVYGLDYKNGFLCDCSWDKTVSSYML